MRMIDGPGLRNALKAAETGRLNSIRQTTQVLGSPFEDMAGLRPPVLGLPESAGIVRLRGLFGRAIAKPTPATRGLFEVMAKGAMSPQMVDYVLANNQTIDHLKREAGMLRPQLRRLPTPGFVMGHAALDLISQARHFGDLTDSPAVRGRIGKLIAKRAAVEIAPFMPKLQPAIAEVLTTGTLSQRTLDAIGPKGARQLVRRLQREIETIRQLPAENQRMLMTAVESAAATLRRDAKASAEEVRSAVRDAMSPADQRTFDREYKLNVEKEAEISGQTEIDTGKGYQIKEGSMIDKAFDAIPEFEKSGEVGFKKEGRIEGSSSGSYNGKLGSASYEATGNVHASVEANAKGSIKFDGDRLEMTGEVGARVELGAEATVKAQANLFGGAVQMDVNATGAVRAEAHVNASGSLTIGRDENGMLNVHAKGAVDVGASIEAVGRISGSANIAGLKVSGEAYGGVMIGVRAAASGEFGYKDGKVSAGFRIKLALGIGIDFGFKFSFTVPKWIRNFGGTIGNIGKAFKNGFKQIGQSVGNAVETVGNAVKNVGKSIGKAAKKVGKFLSKL